MVKVKICGITNLEDALLSIDCGADILGFNFFEKSPRYVAPQNAAGIIDKIPNDILRVGVFVNMETYRIDEFVQLLKLDAVQLHGDESADFVSELKRETDAKVIKAFRVSSDFMVERVLDFQTETVLLDKFSNEHYGGTGERFDWKIAHDVKGLDVEIFLAGGLTPENVAEAVQNVRPYAVDVASGVESSPGKKDPKKLEAFIKNAKNA